MGQVTLLIVCEGL